MIITKLFPYRDPNFFGVPWGCPVYLRQERGRESELYLRKERGVAQVDKNGNFKVSVTTSQRFIAFGQRDVRTGREPIAYYELAKGLPPVEVSGEHVILSLIVYEWKRSRKDWFNGMEDYVLVDELRRRGFSVKATDHKMHTIRS